MWWCVAGNRKTEQSCDCQQQQFAMETWLEVLVEMKEWECVPEEEKVLGILFFNEVYLHKYHNRRESVGEKRTSTRSEFEFYRMKFIPLLFHVIYNIYYKLTRGKKIYFCVCGFARASVVVQCWCFFSSSPFLLCKYISLASCKAIHAHTCHVETFNISTKRFISSYILFTRWHSQFVSIGLHTDHKVLHTHFTSPLACMCICVLHLVFFFAAFFLHSLLPLSTPHICVLFHWNVRFRQRDFICFACNPCHCHCRIYAAS